MEKTCCFTGHRPHKFPFKYNERHPDCIQLKSLLKREIKKAIHEGYKTFISGMAIGVDIWAAEAVLELRKLHPRIRLVAAVPCLNQEGT